MAGKVCRVKQGYLNVTSTLVAGDGEGSAVVAMERDVKGQEDRHPVYLPENRYRWASNDEVDKPSVVLRGPVRLHFGPKISRPESDNRDWMAKYLPTLGALAIATVAVSLVLALVWYELLLIIKG